MRRTLYLLAAVLAGAVSTASAQARPPVLDARRDTLASNPTGLLVRVRGLLDDAERQDQLLKGYTIQLHWTVQLWRRQFFGGAQPKTEWDVELHAVPVLNQYAYTERVGGGIGDRHGFETLDSLKTWLGTERRLNGPRNLAVGDWYYTVNVDVSVLTQEQVDRQATGGGGDWGEFVRGLFSGGSNLSLTHDRVPFTVRP